MRLPNGYGSVYRLSGTRRNPWAARVTVGWNEKQEFKYIGYYQTRQEALKALANYNASPEQVVKQMTFAEVYAKFSEEHFKKVKTTQPFKRAYKVSYELYDKRLADITQSDLQAVIDNEKADQGKRYLFTTYSLMWKYAERHQIITKEQNRTEYLDVPIKEKSDLHKRFTRSEMQILWDNCDDELVQLILVLCYTGVRPMEFFTLKPYNVHDDYFHIEEGKTKNATRDVPIHDEIKPFMAKALMAGINSQYDYIRWSNTKFKPKIKELVGCDHLPGDCRHTFSSMWADQGLNEMYRRVIQGHSGKGIGEQVYTHIGLERLVAEVNKLDVEFESNIIMHKNA